MVVTSLAQHVKIFGFSNPHPSVQHRPEYLHTPVPAAFLNVDEYWNSFLSREIITTSLRIRATITMNQSLRVRVCRTQRAPRMKSLVTKIRGCERERETEGQKES